MTAKRAKGHLQLESRIRGGVLGLAVGDALGAPLEFSTRDVIRRRHGRVTQMMAGGPWEVRPGEWTDDTAMMLAVAEGLFASPDDPREAVGAGFLRWFEGQPKDVGSTVRIALNNFKAAGNWDAAAARTRVRLRDMAAGNGSLMRTLPVSFAYLHEPDRMIQQSARLSYMTHPHELPGLACVFYNEMVRLLTLGGEREAALERARDLVANNEVLASQNSRTAFLRQVDRVRQLSYGEVRAAGYVLDTLVAALWCFLRAEDFEGAVIEAVGLGDDTDTTGAVTGGLAGVYFGVEAIPERWLSVLAERDRLEEAARGLLALAQRSAERAQEAEAAAAAAVAGGAPSGGQPETAAAGSLKPKAGSKAGQPAKGKAAPKAARKKAASRSARGGSAGGSRRPQGAQGAKAVQGAAGDGPRRAGSRVPRPGPPEPAGQDAEGEARRTLARG